MRGQYALKLNFDFKRYVFIRSYFVSVFSMNVDANNREEEKETGVSGWKKMSFLGFLDIHKMDRVGM